MIQKENSRPNSLHQVNYQNYSDGKQAIKTALGNIWKYSNEKITMLTLMSKQTTFAFYNHFMSVLGS